MADISKEIEQQLDGLQQRVELLANQVFVLTDKSNQALIAAESSNALWIALMEAATPDTRKAVLDGYLHICQQLDASPINQRRTDAEIGFQDMVRQSMISHLKR